MMSRKIALTLLTLLLGTSGAYAKKAPKYEQAHQLTADQAALVQKAIGQEKVLIKAIQQRRYEERFIGVDLVNPGFGLFAQAFGVSYWSARDEATFELALRESLNLGRSSLIEVCPRMEPDLR